MLTLSAANARASSSRGVFFVLDLSKSFADEE